VFSTLGHCFGYRVPLTVIGQPAVTDNSLQMLTGRNLGSVLTAKGKETGQGLTLGEPPRKPEYCTAGKRGQRRFASDPAFRKALRSYQRPYPLYMGAGGA
jgi:hypothetical protein